MTDYSTELLQMSLAVTSLKSKLAKMWRQSSLAETQERVRLGKTIKTVERAAKILQQPMQQAPLCRKPMGVESSRTGDKDAG
jgi:hypothetical protein